MYLLIASTEDILAYFIKIDHNGDVNQKLKVILAGNSIFVFAGSLLVPLYVVLVSRQGGTIELAGILFGIPFLSSFVTELFIVRLKDKKSLDVMLLQANFLIRGAVWLVLAFTQTIPVLFLAQIVIGMTEAIGSPAFNSLVSENLDQKNHIREWGMWELVKNPLIALASAMGGFIVTIWGFRVLFIFMSTLAFLSLTYIRREIVRQS